MRVDIGLRKNEVLNWINEKRSKQYICMQLNCKPSTLESFFKKCDIQYDGNRGAKGHKTGKEKSYLEYVGTDKFITAYNLKIKLFKQKVKEKKCEECNNTKWNGFSIPLELHHVDGNRFNNKLENLKILCPNCHSLTDNHAGKGIKRVSKIKKEVKNRPIKLPSSPVSIEKTCVKCQSSFLTKNKKRLFCSQSCSKRGINKIKWPEDEDLISLVEKLGFLQAGKHLIVSDNAIHRRVKSRKLVINNRFSKKKEYA